MELKHYDHDGRARFVTFVIHQRIPLLTSDLFRQRVIDAIDEIRTRFELKLLAYVIMPEHVHLVVIPPLDVKLGNVIGEIKRISARRIHLLLKQVQAPIYKSFFVTRNQRDKFSLWQRRCYDHNCRSNKYVREKIEYCHNNPVIRKFVSSPDQWIWSSYNWYQGKTNVPLLMDECEIH